MISVDILFFLSRTVKLQPKSAREVIAKCKGLWNHVLLITRPYKNFTGFWDTLYIFWYFRIKGNQYIERKNTKKEMASGGSAVIQMKHRLQFLLSDVERSLAFRVDKKT